MKGVTYGTFAPDAAGWQFPSPDRVASDFAMMAAVGINTVRLYTPPSVSLLDEAGRHGLRVMIGIPWSQHVAFLDDRRLCRDIRRELDAQVRRLADHPAVLLFALGNEIPSGVVRWHGQHRIEQFLESLYATAKSAAPGALLTYVNYPTTDYLDLPFLDVVAFNVYLHREADLRAYLARLHHVAGNRPLLLAEAGADSIRNGDEGQASLTAMQLRATYDEGACGAIAFSWTDEWWRGGHSIDDWGFGLVDRQRRPKAALHAAARVFDAADVCSTPRSWPRVSVVVCAYNAADTLDDCLSSLARVNYPSFEVILVDDGSTDGTAEIARAHSNVRVVRVPNGGLGAARNVGLSHAAGEIVAYVDADVRVEPEWLSFLVGPFEVSGVAACGGPNVVPTDDPWFSQCVARAPGSPTHVLLDDRVAEHVPGCNMAVRRDALLSLEGFNPVFARAGDDVDLCWRLQARGWKIAFAPSAMVWHHHRSTFKAFWQQQVGYGEGEAWLKPLHPEKFAGARAIWYGHIYSALPFVRSLRRPKVNRGRWGSAAFPSVYHFDAHPYAHLPHMGRWQVASIALVAAAATASLASLQTIALMLVVLGAAGLAATLAKCLMYAVATNVDSLPPPGRLPRVLGRGMYRGVIAALHLAQPLARMRGRIRGFLVPPGSDHPGFRVADVPLRRAAVGARTLVRLLIGGTVQERFWSERWVSVEHVLAKTIDWLRLSRAVDLITIDEGWYTDRDFSVAIGRLVRVDLRAVVEDHGGGKCLLRVSTRARLTRIGTVMAVVVGMCLAGIAAVGVTVGWSVTSLALGAPVASILAAVASRVRRTAAVLREALGKVAEENGLTVLATEPSRPPRHGWLTSSWIRHRTDERSVPVRRSRLPFAPTPDLRWLDTGSHPGRAPSARRAPDHSRAPDHKGGHGGPRQASPRALSPTRAGRVHDVR